MYDSSTQRARPVQNEQQLGTWIAMTSGGYLGLVDPSNRETTVRYCCAERDLY